MKEYSEKKPLISVVIPVYNVEKHLDKCLQSVLNQTYSNLEIILIDDGSNDKSGEICDAYAKNDKRVKCIHQENKGVSFARNRGIEIATGDYYHFLDSDDYMELDAYEYMLQCINEFNVDGVNSEYYITYPNREEIHRLNSTQYGIKNTAESVYEHLIGGNSFACTKLFPAKSVEGLRFREDIYRDEDTFFAFQVIDCMKQMYFSERPLLHYVQSEESACRGVFRPNQLSAVKMIPIMEEILSEKYPQLLDQWRTGYLHLMIMLYADMYFDECEYVIEQKKIYEEFIKLYKKVDKDVFSRKTKIKFQVFKMSPRLFCFIHEHVH